MKRLQAAGIPAVGFSTTLFDDYNTIDTFNAWIELLKEVMGNVRQGRRHHRIRRGGHSKAVADKLAEVPDEEYPNTLILSNYNESAITAGGTSFANYWITSTGGENLGYDVGAFVGRSEYGADLRMESGSAVPQQLLGLYAGGPLQQHGGGWPRLERHQGRAGQARLQNTAGDVLLVPAVLRFPADASVDGEADVSRAVRRP